MSQTALDYPDEIEEAAMEWRLLISSGSLSASEQREFEAWRSADPRHADAYDQATTLWSALATLEKNKLHPSLFQRKSPRFLAGLLAHSPLRQIASPAGIAAAAALALTVIVGFTLVNGVSQGTDTLVADAPIVVAERTGTGETKTVTLTDGSNVTLGAATVIEVDLSPTARRVRLVQGAAVFDVASDAGRPFTVEAEAFTARVLGTMFDIRSNGGVVRLSVAEGSVEAAHPWIRDGAATSLVERKELVAGQQITATQGEGLDGIQTFNEESFAAWRDDRLRYTGATLAELVADANRYSDRPIILADSLSDQEGERVTLTFDGNEVHRLLATLPVLFAVEIDDPGDGEITIRAR